MVTWLVTEHPEKKTPDEDFQTTLTTHHTADDKTFVTHSKAITIDKKINFQLYAAAMSLTFKTQTLGQSTGFRTMTADLTQPKLLTGYPETQVQL